MKEGGTGRLRAAQETVESYGGKLLGMYWAFGEDDLLLLVEGPDLIGTLANVMAVAASGAVSRLQTTVLFTPEEMDEAIKRTGTYRPPGA
jgi:uncharacterized protein with GYD domain